MGGGAAKPGGPRLPGPQSSNIRNRVSLNLLPDRLGSTSWNEAQARGAGHGLPLITRPCNEHDAAMGTHEVRVPGAQPYREFFKGQ